MGGGFLYTNENTLSLGLLGLHHLHDAKKIGAANAGRFQTTSGRCTADRGRQAGGIFRSRCRKQVSNMLPELVVDGVLIAGDAAGMCMNLGFTIRGMDRRLPPGKQQNCASAMKATISVSKKLAEYRQHLERRCAICACTRNYRRS